MRGGDAVLGGDLVVPHGATGLVAFAHGSGSSRFSPRNRFVAEALQREGLATFLVDLLTPEEEEVDARTGHLRFDVSLLADRLASAVEWSLADETARDLPVGCFGASTGAAAALLAAARHPDAVRAVVSRGGRPDLAGEALAAVRAPTLLIVGGADEPVLALNRDALQRLSGDAQLEVIPHASHLFEEPGASEQVARLAGAWFLRYLGAPS